MAISEVATERGESARQSATGADATSARTRTRFLFDFFLLALERLIQPLIGLYLISSIARNYAPEEFSAWQVAYALLAVFSVVASVTGERVVLPRLCTAALGAYESVWKTALVAKLVSGAVVACLVVGAGLFRDHRTLMPVLIVFAVMVLLAEPLGLPVSELNARKNFRRPVIVRWISSVVRLGLVILFVHLHAPLWVLALSWVGEQMIFVIMLMQPRDVATRWRAATFQWRDVRALFVNGAALALSASAMIALTRIDRLVFDQTLPRQVLVNNGAAMTVLEAAFGLAATLAVLSGSHALFRSDGIERRSHLRLTLFSVTIGATGGAVLFVAAPLIATLMFGAKMASGVEPMLRLGSGLVPLFFAMSVVQLPLQAHARSSYHVMRGFGAFAISVLVGWLVVHYGRNELISLGAYAGLSCALLADVSKLYALRDRIYAN